MPEPTPDKTLKHQLMEERQRHAVKRDELQRELEWVTRRIDDIDAAVEGIDAHRRSQP